MEPAIQALQEGIFHACVQKAVYPSDGTELMSMGEKKNLTFPFCEEGVWQTAKPNLFHKVIRKPQVMIADLEKNGYACISQGSERAQETHMPFGYSMMILKPEVK